jgi:hypothetical protein
MKQQGDPGDNRELKPRSLAARLFVNGAFWLGIATLGVGVALVILALLPASPAKTTAVRAIQGFVNSVVNGLFGGSVTPPPDPPIVVRSGSLDVYANHGNLRWQQVPLGPNYLYQADVGELPSTLYLDGVVPNTMSHGSDPETITLNTINNWTITFNMRPNGQQSGPTALICPQLSPKGLFCDPDPTGLLTAEPSRTIYFQGSAYAMPEILDIDRTNKNARLHFPIPNCDLAREEARAAGQHADNQCDKVDSFTMKQTSMDPVTYWCIDGACSVGIGQPMN